MSLLTQDCTTPIQSYGLLIYTDFFDHITGISAYTKQMVGREAEDYLGRDVRDFLSGHFPSHNDRIIQIVYDIKNQEITNKILDLPYGDQLYSLRLSLVKNFIQWEWEPKKTAQTPAFQMEDMAQVLESSSKSLWDKLCETVLGIIGYDRAYVCQLHENGNSEIIAESAMHKPRSVVGARFSQEFMSDSDIALYASAQYRYVPDLFAPLTKLYSLPEECLDAKPSHLHPIPSVHRDYAGHLGAKSFIAFSLVANGRLWGLLVAHSFTTKDIDLSKRQLCNLVSLYAAKKQESYINNNLLLFQETITDALLKVRSELMTATNMNGALVKQWATLQKIPQADGLVISIDDDFAAFGTTPSQVQIAQILQLVRQLKDKPLFVDSNFRLRYAHLIDGELNFAGIIALRLGKNREVNLLWFREEEVDEVYQTAPVTMHVHTEAEDIADTVFSNEMWVRTVVDSARSWSTNDLYFVKRLRSLLQETMLAKAEEKERINQQLISLNNELEMLTFTLSHDLKNPLSVVKLSSQVLTRNMTDLEKTKWLNILSEGVGDIEHLVNSVLSVGKSRIYHFEKSQIPMAQMIEKIVMQTQLLQNSKHGQVKLGSLLPLWGDKSLLHQVFQNVIGNAIKYSRERVTPQISIHSYLDDMYTIYEIQDNGIGIPTTELEHIFHVFKRSSNVGKIDGTGVGLALVRRILDRLQATVAVSSQENEGTLVKLTFTNVPGA